MEQLEKLLNSRPQYPVIYHITPDHVSIEIPDLPGICTCGDTLKEARYNAIEAISLHLWGMAKDDDPIPQPTPLEAIVIPDDDPEGSFIKELATAENIMQTVVSAEEAEEVTSRLKKARDIEDVARALSYIKKRKLR